MSLQVCGLWIKSRSFCCPVGWQILCLLQRCESVIEVTVEGAVSVRMASRAQISQVICRGLIN